MVKILKAMYNDVQICIKYNGEYSDFFSSHTGVKQGEPLSPTLFLMFINDMVECIAPSADNAFIYNDFVLYTLLFADDTVLFSKSKVGLQSLLNNLQCYCKDFDITINKDKTKIVIFQNGRPPSCNNDFYIDGSKVDVVNSYNYLGVLLSYNGKFKLNESKIVEQGSVAVHNLYNILSDCEISIDKKCFMFDTLVTPVLSYASEVWGFNEYCNIEKVHLKFCKFILNLKKSTVSSAVYGELGRMPLKINRLVKI